MLEFEEGVDLDGMWISLEVLLVEYFHAYTVSQLLRQREKIRLGLGALDDGGRICCASARVRFIVAAVFAVDPVAVKQAQSARDE